MLFGRAAESRLFSQTRARCRFGPRFRDPHSGDERGSVGNAVGFPHGKPPRPGSVRRVRGRARREAACRLRAHRPRLAQQVRGARDEGAPRRLRGDGVPPGRALRLRRVAGGEVGQAGPRPRGRRPLLRRARLARPGPRRGGPRQRRRHTRGPQSPRRDPAQVLGGRASSPGTPSPSCRRSSRGRGRPWSRPYAAKCPRTSWRPSTPRRAAGAPGPGGHRACRRDLWVRGCLRGGEEGLRWRARARRRVLRRARQARRGRRARRGRGRPGGLRPPRPRGGEAPCRLTRDLSRRASPPPAAGAPRRARHWTGGARVARPGRPGTSPNTPGPSVRAGTRPGGRSCPGGAPCRRPRCPAATTGGRSPGPTPSGAAAAVPLLPRPPRGRRARGRRRPRQDAHAGGAVRALPPHDAPGEVPRGALPGRAAREGARRRVARPRARPAREGGAARDRRARLPAARRGRREAALPGRLGVLRETVARDNHQPGVRQVGDRLRRRPDGRGGRRPRLPPREAAPARGRVVPRRACARVGEGGGATAAGDGPGDGVVLRCTRGDIAALGDPGRALRHVSDDAILSARCDGLPRDGTVDLWMEEVRCDGPDALGFVWCEAVLRPDGEPPGPSD